MAVNSTGNQSPINILTPGTGASQRVAMKVSVTSIEFKGRLWVAADTGVDQVVRYIVLLDRQANGAAPTLLSSYLEPANIYGLRNLANRRRFRAILDKMYTLNAADESGSQRIVKFYVKFRRPIVVEFNTGLVGDVTDIVSNSMWFITLGSEVAGDTSANCTGTVRIRYTDL